MIEERAARRYLARAREIKQSNMLLDAHAHPFELFYGTGNYRRDPDADGVYSAGPDPFIPPRLRDLPSQDDERTKRINRLLMRPGLAALNLGRLYHSTGPTVFEMHMDLAAIDKVLLLPVLRPQDEIDPHMSRIEAMFGGNERFLFGWCVPGSMRDDEISNAAEAAVRRFHVRAVKLHPNITEINPQSLSGRRRIEAILKACNRLSLPLIVHGGMSPQLGEREVSSYGLIRHLKEIDWSITDYPVVISHAGAYGCDAVETIDSLRELRRMLLTHKNLLVDVSALEVRTLALLLAESDTKRIIFGSDMLYESPWITLVRLLIALEMTTLHPEEIFLDIASANPQRYLFSSRGPCPFAQGHPVAEERRSAEGP